MTPAERRPDGAGSAGAGAAGAAPATAERWRAIQRLVDGALDLPPAERGAYLARRCGSDAALYESAAHLLEACERAAGVGGILAAPAAELAVPMLAELAAHDAARAVERRAALFDALRSALSERYAVERELGRGGMATVYLARDIRHDRAVAVKVLERSVAPEGAERFLHEIRIAARLTHPHVLPVHDSGEAGDPHERTGSWLLYYVMPYVEGETLRARMAREGALPVADATRLVRELADALAYAHARGVVHRDLKPENVLISGGHAVVADFGIAKAVAAATQDGRTPGAGLTSAGVALGTPAYMAPEQAVGDPATDHRADLYALGVVAYEMLAGAHPFGARPPQALVAAHLNEAPVPLGERRLDVPPALAALVMRLLAKDPAARVQSAADVLRALDGVAEAPSVTPLATRRLTLTAAVLLAAAGVGGYALWRSASTSGNASDREAAHGAASGASVPLAIRTLAVLPFINTGGTAADDYFSDGMTDELAHALARVPGLRLAGRTSSYTFKGRAAPAQEIGRVLEVDAIVNGTVRRAGDRVRVTTQLVTTSDGKVLWDSVFESRSSDVFAVQDEFTRATVAALRPSLGDSRVGTSLADVRRGTQSQEAYDLFLKGRYHWLERGTVNVSRAILYFRQAIAKDPTFARAHAGLALAYGVLPSYIFDPTDSASTRMTTSARTAVALDSTLADAQLALGVALELQLRFADAEARYRQALALEPSNAFAHHVLGMLLLSIRHPDDAAAELRRAVQLDPLAKSAASGHAAALITARRFPEGLEAARRVLTLDSSFALGIWGLGFAQTFAGQPDSAVVTLERGLRLHPDLPAQRSVLLLAYATAGRWADAERVRAELRRPGGDRSGGPEAAFAELVFGDPEPLVRLMSAEGGQRSWSKTFTWFGCNPLLDPLWSDSRFRAAMRTLTIQPCPLVQPWRLPPRPGA